MFGNWDPVRGAQRGTVRASQLEPAPSHPSALLLSRAYMRVTGWRRWWHARHPEARRRLERPVISVGNLSWGGTAKTPTVAYICELLLEAGEHPSILTRGYGRTQPQDGVVVVRDRQRVLADLARAGDEPLMLARGLEGAVVLAGADRYLAGRLGEKRFGCTVHILDDGFQHLRLARDVDLVLIDRESLAGANGHLRPMREGLDAARSADALLVHDTVPDAALEVFDRPSWPRRFSLRRVHHAPRLLEPLGEKLLRTAGLKVLAVAGVARPERFFHDLDADGWQIAGRLTFPDHHCYTGEDVYQIVRAAWQVRAEAVLTTEKDVMRLRRHRPIPVPLAWVPMAVRIDPADQFRDWLLERVGTARGEGITETETAD